MASADSLITLDAANAKLPASSAASFVQVTGGSTPAEQDLLLSYPDSGTVYADLKCTMPEHYAGGGLTVTVVWDATVNTGNAGWGGAIRRVADNAENFTASHSYTFQDSSAAAAPSTVGNRRYTTISFTNAQIDGLQKNEEFWFRLRRNTGVASNLSGAARVSQLHVKET